MKKEKRLLKKFQKQQKIYQKAQQIYDGFYKERFRIQGSNYSAKGYKDEFLCENKLYGYYDIWRIRIGKEY